MMGGALSLAVLASLAAARTDSLIAIGAAHVAALNKGDHVSFLRSVDAGKSPTRCQKQGLARPLQPNGGTRAFSFVTFVTSDS